MLLSLWLSGSLEVCAVMAARTLKFAFRSFSLGDSLRFTREKWKVFANCGIKVPEYAYGKKEKIPKLPDVHNAEQINNLYKAGQIARQVLNDVGPLIAPGISTSEIEFAVIERCLEYKVYPSPLHYEDFPRYATTFFQIFNS